MKQWYLRKSQGGRIDVRELSKVVSTTSGLTRVVCEAHPLRRHAEDT